MPPPHPPTPPPPHTHTHLPTPPPPSVYHLKQGQQGEANVAEARGLQRQCHAVLLRQERGGYVSAGGLRQRKGGTSSGEVDALQAPAPAAGTQTAANEPSRTLHSMPAGQVLKPQPHISPLLLSASTSPVTGSVQLK